MLTYFLDAGRRVASVVRAAGGMRREELGVEREREEFLGLDGDELAGGVSGWWKGGWETRARNIEGRRRYLTYPLKSLPNHSLLYTVISQIHKPHLPERPINLPRSLLPFSLRSMPSFAEVHNWDGTTEIIWIRGGARHDVIVCVWFKEEVDACEVYRDVLGSQCVCHFVHVSMLQVRRENRF